MNPVTIPEYQPDMKYLTITFGRKRRKMKGR